MAPGRAGSKELSAFADQFILSENIPIVKNFFEKIDSPQRICENPLTMTLGQSVKLGYRKELTDMKIGEAAKRTGLTEKAIRVYVDNGLIHPVVESGTHRNSYDFTEENVRELEKISVFRKAGFSIFEISVIQREPNRLPELIGMKRESLEMEVEFRHGVQEALARLEVEEMGNPTKVAAALRPAVENRKIKTDNGSRRWIFVTISILGIVGTLLAFRYMGVSRYGGFRSYHGGQSWANIGYAVGFVMAMLSFIPGIMAIRYGTCTGRARRMGNKTVATVVNVMEDHRFDGGFARAGSGGAGTREPGIGGSWQWRFMIWNEIRYDCWFPILEYQHGGKRRTGTLVYGAFRGDFHPGDRIEVAWRDKAP